MATLQCSGAARHRKDPRVRVRDRVRVRVNILSSLYGCVLSICFIKERMMMNDDLCDVGPEPQSSSNSPTFPPDFSRYFSHAEALIFIKPPEVYRQAYVYS